MALADQDDAGIRTSSRRCSARLGDARLAYSDTHLIDGEGNLVSDTYWTIAGTTTRT